MATVWATDTTAVILPSTVRKIYEKIIQENL